MIRVKICGIGTPADACIAAEAGAEFIGMVFVPERHRRITPDAAREIVDAVHDLDAPHPRMVGLFADQPLEEVNETIAHCGLDAVQLCGKESVEYTADVDCQVVKVVHVPASYRAPDDVPQLAERVGEYADAGVPRHPRPLGRRAYRAAPARASTSTSPRLWPIAATNSCWLAASLQPTLAASSAASGPGASMSPAAWRPWARRTVARSGDSSKTRDTPTPPSPAPPEMPPPLHA